MNIQELIAIINESYQQFLKSENNEDRYDIQFPLAVFGTLRLGCGNDQRYLLNPNKPSFHCRAFLSHFLATGLWLEAEIDASAPVEIFYHEPQYWKDLIARVDRLEGFHKTSSRGGYIRTLANIHILPEDYENDVFSLNLHHPRNLKIPKEEWNNYQTIPCWVYSNYVANRTLKAVEDSPIIWYF